MIRRHRFQPRHRSNLTIAYARQDEIRAARRSIPISSPVIAQAYCEIIERYGDLHLDIEELEAVDQDEDLADAGAEARERVETLCKGGRRHGAVSEKEH